MHGIWQASCPAAPEVHSELLANYVNGHDGLWDVPDDGYILQARTCTSIPPR